MSERRTISLEEFHATLAAQGVPQEHYAFKCVRCGNVQSFASLVRHISGEQAMKTSYFSCEGRFCAKEHGCDWTLGGLLSIHTLEVIAEDGTRVPVFEPASPDEAQALMAEVEKTMRRCRVCGCSEFHPCAGGCSWVEQDLCSACAGK